MRQIADQHLIRAILERDRPWAAFVLADLEAPYSRFATWFCADGDQPPIALVYRGFERPVLICIGDTACFDPVFDQVEATLAASEQVYAVVRPDVLVLLEKRYRVDERKSMLRMVLDVSRYRMGSTDGVVVLGTADLAEVQALYGDGHARGESPEFFVPSMLNHGVYFGIYESGDLVAVAGTHVVAPTVGVAGLGNIYTWHDKRRHGYGTRVTSAVTNKLRSMGITTIVLNVRTSNDAAIRVYERLVYVRYCNYYEAIAHRIR